MPAFNPITAAYHGLNRTLEFIGGISYLVADTIAASGKALFAKRGRQIGWENLWYQMVRVGVKSIPIVSLVLFCIGAILALQLAPTLRRFGSGPLVADLIGIAVYRELGPLISAIVLTGFAGASIAAELGTMVVSEEVEALESMAIPPVRFLVVPRVVATTIMMVCLAVVGDVMGTLGGMFVGTNLLSMGALQYFSHTFGNLLHTEDFLTGIFKSGVFGVVISTLACYLGLSVTGGAQGVGVATTRTVVYTIVSLILVDLLFTAVFYFFNL